MLEIIGTIFGSVFSGGATGLIGVGLQRYADYKNKQLDIQLAKQKFDQDLALKQVDMQMMEKEWAGRVQVAQTEALTVYLCAISTLIYLQARELVGKENLTSEQALQIENLIVGTILYLTTTCVLWWFGTRNKQQVPKLG